MNAAARGLWHRRPSLRQTRKRAAELLSFTRCPALHRKQQEVLQRRRSNSWQAEVRERRAEVSKYLRDPAYKKQVCAGATHLLCVSNNSWCVITRVTVLVLQIGGRKASRRGYGNLCRRCEVEVCNRAALAALVQATAACPTAWPQVDEEKRARFKARKEQEVRLPRPFVLDWRSSQRLSCLHST